MDILGLIAEILLAALGVYIYLFARGFVKITDPRRSEQAAAFRDQNAGWMRLLGLGLAAIMLLNVFLHLRQLLS
ncbi:MAG: hypothetical protein DA408_04855 [Bacteroidetes bacterium]|nr:MAG: hypothetical protein C7N36_18605 [Bacteroidota bacterium]PTM13931.1 MAG: hypothetical protein DA408_04855 [Bacteroidota bacterium]